MSQHNEAYATVDARSAFSEHARMLMLKSVCLIGITALALDQTFSLFYNNYLYNHLSSFVGYGVLGGVLFLVDKRKNDLAKDMFSYAGIIFAAIHHYLYGVSIGAEMLYLIFILLSAYLYDSNKSLFVLGAASLSYCVIQLTIVETTPIGVLYSNVQLKIFVFLTSVALITFFFRNIFGEEEVFNDLKVKHNERLMISNEQLRRFNYVVVNDLKSPISGIIEHSSALISDQEFSIEEEKERAQLIIDGGNKLSEIVQSIRSFQALEETDFIYEKVRIVDAVEESCRTLRQLMDSNRTTISYEANKDVVTSHYQLFITFKSLVEHIIAYKQDICMNIHFSFDDADKDYMRIYLDTVTFGPEFKILPRVAHKEYVLFDEGNNGETHMDMIVIQKMVNQLGGSVYCTTDVNVEKAYLIELPKNKKLEKNG